jgi:iron complex transport system substrate-binding protein
LSCLAAAVLNAATLVPAVADEPPRRVVSMNVCTDQLAMLIAGEGQLHSVSALASDPRTSAMAGEARAFPANHALAEEIFLMQPDLVLAGTFSARATVGLLRRLGFRVEEFAPAASFTDIRDHIARIGQLLHRQERAAELVAQLDEGLARLKAGPHSGRTIALYEPNSYTAGGGTLANEIFRAAGLVNIAEGLGITGSTRLPLEQLVMAKPDLIGRSSSDYGAPALAQENLVHPAFRALSGQEVIDLPVAKMICGAPFTLDAAFLLQDAAAKQERP